MRAVYRSRKGENIKLKTTVTIDDLTVVMDALQYVAGSYDELELKIATSESFMSADERSRYEREMGIRRERGKGGTLASRVAALKEELLEVKSQ